MQVTSQAQPNIALVKYWGKRDADRNLPATGSLSVTLDALWTRMTVEFDGGEGDRLHVNGKPEPSMLPRVSRCLDKVAGTNRSGARIVSECNFPIAAGLASSASSFAALVHAASRASGQRLEPLALARLAGQASGSAARSLYGGFVELRAGDDEIEVSSIAAPDDWPLSVTVAVTERAAKPVSSGAAMSASRESSPFYDTWVERQPGDLDKAREAVRMRDFAALAAVAEHNCLKMHSVMWTSRPPIVYWNTATVACLETVRTLQRDGIAVFFTIDAGPQVKAVSLPESAHAVANALRGTTGVIDVLHSSLGTGARLVDPD